MKKQLIILLITILLVQTSCKEKTMNEKTNFIYEIEVGAPKEFPCEVHLGMLSKNDTFITAIPNAGIAMGGWGVGSGTGLKAAIIPNHLELTWISYAEKKFWKIDTALPEEKMLDLFQKGYDLINRKNEEEHLTYNALTIGLAPGGVVVVWLDGIYRVEVGRFQATEAYVNKLDFEPVKDPDESQEQFFERRYKVVVSESSKEQIKKEGIPFGLWDNYRQKYNWRYTTISYKAYAPEEVTFEGTDYINGEFAMFDDAKQRVALIKEFSLKPLPWRTDFSYINNYSSFVKFDKPEIMLAFKTIAQKNPNQPIEIVINVGFEYRGLTFKVKCGKDEIQLEKVEVKMYGNG
jgi:hypothetical protein